MAPGITDRLKYFYESCETLKSLKKKYTLNEIESNRDLCDIMERNFEKMIVASVDIVNYYIAEKKLPKPKSYVESFFVLSDAAGLIKTEEKQIFKEFVENRNIITHEYFSVNYEKIYSLLDHIPILISLIEKITSQIDITEI